MKFDLLIINRGDRQALVKDAGCYVKRGDGPGSSPLKQFESLPIILEPSEMRLTSIDIPLPEKPGKAKGGGKQNFGIYFYSINSEGRLHHVTKNLFWRNYTKNGWTGKVLLDGSNMIVDLYSKNDSE